MAVCGCLVKGWAVSLTQAGDVLMAAWYRIGVAPHACNTEAVINPMEVGPMSEDYKGPTWDHWAELTARVEALEATQNQPAKAVTDPVWTDTPAPSGSLVERVAGVICDDGEMAHLWHDDARAAIRAATGDKVAAIAATLDTAELAAYITSADYPNWPLDPNAPVVLSADDGLEPAGDQPTE